MENEDTTPSYAQLNALIDVAQEDIEASTVSIEKSANNIQEIRQDNHGCKMMCKDIAKQPEKGIINKFMRRKSNGNK